MSHKKRTGTQRDQPKTREEAVRDFTRSLALSAFGIAALVLIDVATSGWPPTWSIMVGLLRLAVLLMQGGHVLFGDRRPGDVAMGRLGRAEGYTEDDESRSDGRPYAAPTQADRATDDAQRMLTEGFALVDRMRADARLIPGAAPRQEAMATCTASERVLDAFREHPDEQRVLTEFLDRFLQPASSLIRDYARLSSRNVASAEATLRSVEETDLPALTQRADAFHDRLHRGTIIDLETAREMLEFDAPSFPSPHDPARVQRS